MLFELGGLDKKRVIASIIMLLHACYKLDSKLPGAGEQAQKLVTDILGSKDNASIIKALLNIDFSNHLNPLDFNSMMDMLVKAVDTTLSQHDTGQPSLVAEAVLFSDLDKAEIANQKLNADNNFFTVRIYSILAHVQLEAMSLRAHYYKELMKFVLLLKEMRDKEKAARYFDQLLIAAQWAELDRRLEQAAIDRIMNEAKARMGALSLEIKKLYGELNEIKQRKRQIVDDLSRQAADQFENYQVNGKKVFADRKQAENFAKDYIPNLYNIERYAKHPDELDKRLGMIDKDLSKVKGQRHQLSTQLISENYRGYNSALPQQKVRIIQSHPEIAKLDVKISDLELEKRTLKDIKSDVSVKKVQSDLVAQLAEKHNVDLLKGTENQKIREQFLEDHKALKDQVVAKLDPITDEHIAKEEQIEEKQEDMKEARDDFKGRLQVMGTKERSHLQAETTIQREDVEHILDVERKFDEKTQIDSENVSQYTEEVAEAMSDLDSIFAEMESSDEQEFAPIPMSNKIY